MEIQNELKKIAVSEVQINKMKEVYGQAPKTNAQQSMNINSIEQIAEAPTNNAFVSQQPEQEVFPFANGSTSIFDIPEQPVVEQAEPAIQPIQEPIAVINETPKIEPNISQTPETNIFNVQQPPVMEQVQIAEPTQSFIENQPVPTLESNNLSQNVETKDQEILDKLYDLQIHINQFAIELEEYLSKKNNNIKDVEQVQNNVKEQTAVKTEQPVSTINYDENINIFDAPNSFKL